MRSVRSFDGWVFGVGTMMPTESKERYLGPLSRPRDSSRSPASATFALPARSSRFPFPRNRNRTTRPTATGPGGRDAPASRARNAPSRVCFARRRSPGHAQRQVVRTQAARPERRARRPWHAARDAWEVRQTCVRARLGGTRARAVIRGRGGAGAPNARAGLRAIGVAIGGGGRHRTTPPPVDIRQATGGVGVGDDGGTR